ncbi:MAG: TlpA family protein disulfide reductase [Cyclobacteriaceae bacterium]|nr:TlpA family protein disulfide reductase [Cyclobacteriaceae bacterium]
MAGFQIKKELKEWGIFAIILLTLYFTGLHTEVAAFAQRAVLATGIANPNTDPIEYKEKAAYDFTLTGMDGNTLDFETLKGKVIFINMWATWCAPCIAEMPSIQELYNKYKDNSDAVFVMISFDKDPEKAKNFIARKEYDLPVYFPNETQIPKVYDSKGIPTTYVIDKKGYIAYRKVGMASYDSNSFVKLMDGLLAK